MGNCDAELSQNLKDVCKPYHHVNLTDEGKEQLIANTYCGNAHIAIPGSDDGVKSEGGDDRLANPDVPSTQHFRHVWIMRRRPRPNAPAFSGAPIPHRCRGEGERATMITMTHFHLWTLRNAEADA